MLFGHSNINNVFFKKLWSDLKDLLDTCRDISEVDCKLKESLYNWGLQYMYDVSVHFDRYYVIGAKVYHS